MSLPQEIKEELLSAYLDDALSGDERRRVEQMLARDEEARALFEQLTSLQQATRAALRTTDAAPPEFASRVLAEAKQRATDEALPATHHVRLADPRRDEAPVPPRDQPSSSHWHPLGPVIALAAALLLAVTLWQNPFGGSDDTRSVAQPNVAPDRSSTSELAEAEPAGDSPSAAPSSPAPETVAEAPSGNEAPSGRSSEAVSGADVVPSPNNTNRDPRNREGPRLADASPATTSQESAPMQPAPLPPTTQTEDPEEPASLLAAQAVMIFEVEQTDRGRENRAVFQAMQEAGIRANGSHAINEAVVGYLQEAELVGGPPQETTRSADSRPVSIVYVEASGKQLDRFMVSLFANTDEIGRIGWNLAMDAPVVAAMRAISDVVPTEVQSTDAAGTAWQIVAPDREGRFPAAAAERTFLPIDRRDPEAWQGGGSASLGADIRSRLLILIR